MRNGRLLWLRRDELDDGQRRLYDRIVGGARGVGRLTPLMDDEGRLEGPFGPLLTNPGLGDALQSVGAALRFAGTLPHATFELLVLTVAAERGSPYEWYGHLPLARAAGVDLRVIEAVRTGLAPKLRSAADRDVLALAHALLRHEDPGAGLVRDVETAYGASGVTEIVAIVGYYDLIANLLLTWDTQLPQGVQDPLADRSHGAKQPI